MIKGISIVLVFLGSVLLFFSLIAIAFDAVVYGTLNSIPSIPDVLFYLFVIGLVLFCVGMVLVFVIVKEREK